MSPRDLRALAADLRAWNRAQQRAREEYAAHPIAFARAHADCDYPYCHNTRAAKGLCERHLRIYERARGEVGAA